MKNEYYSIIVVNGRSWFGKRFRNGNYRRHIGNDMIFCIVMILTYMYIDLRIELLIILFILATYIFGFI